ncbi:MAG: GTP-binding protein [Lachnospiraceae bacterium]|nr:GTP-binding protein [Lachnospiraceae bacterium]
MTKIDIISGFLGAGKTTLIRKLISEAFKGQKIVLIENEFGEIGIDGGFLKDAGINITEMNSGCICCSLVGDFGEALGQVMRQFAPDRIIIEPSGVGKLSDVRRAVENVAQECDIEINSLVTVADATKVKLYMKNFGEFYNNQVESAGTIILSRTQKISQERLDAAIEMIREKNATATIITTPWDDLTGTQIVETMEKSASLAADLLAEVEEEHHHHHDHDDDDDEHEHHHHHHDHDDDEDEHEHHHHHHDHDDDHDEHEHHHHHDHDDDDDDDDDEHEHHHHDHDHEHEHHHHHHDHHADEVFDSIGFETSKKFTKAQIEDALKALDDTEKYGMILRSKGIVAGEDGSWIHFDFVPEEVEVRTGASDVTGKIVVIGSEVKKDAVKELFGI